MSQPWWGKDRSTHDARKASRLVEGEFGRRPVIHPDGADAVMRQLRERRATFAGEWADPSDVDPSDVDAGGALVDLFSRQASPVLRRLNRLPEKTLIEFLNLAGVRPASPRNAVAMVQFLVSPAARDPIEIPKGFQVGARPATGSGDLVVFETQDSFSVTPADIVKAIVVQGASERDVTAENAGDTGSFAPLGTSPQIGSALAIGIGNTARFSASISLGVQVTAVPGAPPPISSGGVSPIPLPVVPVLRWEALVGSQFVPMVVIKDETNSLWQSGIVQLQVPQAWTPAVLTGAAPLYWLRLRLIQGQFTKPPELNFVRLNMARVAALRTIYDEILTPIDGPSSSRLQLLHTPIIPESLVIAVEATPLDVEDPTSPEGDVWQQVDDLSEIDGQQHVYTLDPDSGIVTFGDGHHGAAVPPGFRNVRAVQYQVTSGAEGAVGSKEISTLLNSAPLIVGVVNPMPASGGVAADTQEQAIRSGPAMIQARGRAVTSADFAVMARLAPGANVHRAHAIPCYHPMFPGSLTPGVVGVFVVPAIEGSGPPLPNEASLRAVGEHLSTAAAPAGVEIVVAAPTYRLVRTEVEFVAAPTANISEVQQKLTAELDRYLHPLTGGERNEGWPFGGTLYFSKLILRLLTKVPHVRAIRRLRLIVDGVPRELCSDVALRATELFWSVRHQVIPVNAGGN